MECKIDKNEHFWHPLLFTFNQGSKITKAAWDICNVYREGAITEGTTQKWSSRGSGRPVQFNGNWLNELIHEEEYITDWFVKIVDE